MVINWTLCDGIHWSDFDFWRKSERVKNQFEPPQRDRKTTSELESREEPVPSNTPLDEAGDAAQTLQDSEERGGGEKERLCGAPGRADDFVLCWYVIN